MPLQEADTGKGASCSIATVVIPNVQDVTTKNTGEIITEDVADGRLTAVVGTGWAWTVTFAMPKTGSHTLINSLKAGGSGALDLNQGGTRYTDTTAQSGNLNITSNPCGITIPIIHNAAAAHPIIASHTVY